MNSKIIKNAVESTFNTFIDQKTRKREIVYMRSIYFKLCKELTHEPLNTIGKQVNLHHATVIHGLKIFDNIIDNFWEKEMFNSYLHIRQKLKKRFAIHKRRGNPDTYYREKYRIALLQNKGLYNYTKECINKLEQMDYKYPNVLREKLNNLIDNKNYKANTTQVG